MEREQIEAAEAAEEEARRDAQEAAREAGAPSLDLEIGDEITLPKNGAAAPGPDAPGQSPPQPTADPGAVKPNEQTAAAGLEEQVKKATGTTYVLFKHGIALERGDLEKLTDGIQVKSLGGGVETLEGMYPIGSGSFTGAPAALLACRDRFGEGEYAAIPLRNITAKVWKKEQVAKWV